MPGHRLNLTPNLLSKRPEFGTLRWKFFGILSLATALPVIILTVHVSTAESRARSEALVDHVQIVAQMLAEQLGPALAEDDAQRARATFYRLPLADVPRYGVLTRPDGSTLYAFGAPPLSDADEIAPTSRPTARTLDDRVVARVPVPTSRDGVGTLILALGAESLPSTAVDGLTITVAIGAGIMLLGCLIAWLVGSSFGRRIERVRAQAQRVAGGDLRAQPTPPDSGTDEIGDLGRAFHAMVGVIEREVAERTAAVEASRDQYRRLLETTHTVPWEMAPGSWRFTEVGMQIAEISDVPYEVWTAPDFWSSHVDAGDAERVRAVLAETLSARTRSEVEFGLLRNDGAHQRLRMHIGASNDGHALRGFILDVTERRDLEVELRQAQKLESVGRLASGIAHEINTPVQFINDSVHFVQVAFEDLIPLLQGYRDVHPALEAAGRTDLVASLRDIEEDADLDYSLEHVPRALDRAIDGLDRVAIIVRSMREFAHPDQRQKAGADLNAAINATLCIATNEYKYVADVETDFAPLPMVSCHVGELNQAFLNIIVNAAHAIEAKVEGTGERGRIRVSTRAHGDEVEIRIADDGGGIPADVQPRIFDPFFTTKEVGRGTGQGLAIARNVVVEKHGGALSFEVAPGVGTTFFIRVPVMAPDELRSGDVPELAAVA